MQNQTPITISGITIYPVKGMGGIAVQQARVLPKGLAHDRRWMLVDENNLFISQRNTPQLALCQISLFNAHLTISYQQETVMVPFACTGNHFSAIIWDDEVVVQEVDDNVSAQLSAILCKKVRLVYFPEDNDRSVDPAYAVDNNHTSLSDGYPILIISEASLDDLNSRLEVPVAMNRFRPNIVVSGAPAFAEDSWRHFTAGQLEMYGVKPCSRCTVTTINQENASPGPEPLRTLSSFRKMHNKVYFGMNIIPGTTGVISIGDVITILQTN